MKVYYIYNFSENKWYIKLFLTKMQMEKIIQNNILLDILIGKKWRIIRHVMMLIFLAILFYPNIDTSMIKKINFGNADDIVAALNKTALAIYFISVFFIYFNLFFLTPRYLLKNKYLLYFVGCLLSILLYSFLEITIGKYCLNTLSDIVPFPRFSFKGFVDSAFLPIIFFGATAGLQIFKKWIRDSALLAELKQSKVEQELLQLKNQINPHFLFNTLNNLNTLITVDPNKASAIVLGLSDVLRYQLYEADENKVLLKKDIEILRQFLELEKIRRDNFQFSITTEGEIAAVFIPPFVFINFVENAIKHSVDNTGFSYISLYFNVANNHLYFTCKNSKPSTIKAKVNGGLGLQNIKRRLELMYEGNFTLDINDDEKEFLITLDLPL
jgi:Histidine kinase/GHKL domain